MYSRKEHAERIISTFGFDCASCRAAIFRDINAPDIGAVFVARRDDGLYKVGATTTSPIAHIRELSCVTKREHTLVHTISVLDSRALEGQVQRHLDAYLDDRHQWYALPPEVVDVLCSTGHLCDVPSPYLNRLTTFPEFDRFIKALDRATRAVVK